MHNIFQKKYGLYKIKQLLVTEAVFNLVWDKSLMPVNVIVKIHIFFFYYFSL